MKTVVMTCQFTSFSSRPDGSVSFRGQTPELSGLEKCALFDLQNVNARCVIEPVDYAVEDKLIVKKEIGQKTPSERLRAILFVAFRHSGDEDFQAFYSKEMARICQQEKDRLPKESF